MSALLQKLTDFPILLTRDSARARAWLRNHRRGPERAGLLASSNALRLKPKEIYVKASVDPPLWFLAPGEDVRSSDALEDVATEFDVRGLELDWTCVCWEVNFRRVNEAWKPMTFRGTNWQSVSDPDRRAYVANACRVLRTRARQGMVIFVPLGDKADQTRAPELYDPIYTFLASLGIPKLP